MKPRSSPAGGPVSRRAVLAGGVALAGLFGARWAPAGAAGAPLVGFAPVRLAEGGGPNPAISSDYRYSVTIPWGAPLEPGGPPGAADPERRVGIGHDGMTFFPLADGAEGNRRGLLAINHEFGSNARVLGKPMPESAAETRAAQAAIGASIVEIAESEFGVWRAAPSRFARRIHPNTPVEFSGPAAGSPLLATPSGAPPAGTLNNCADGATPWRTWLTCEENFPHYFGARGAFAADSRQARYGLKGGRSRYGWEAFDPRFDLSDPAHANEANRFGWAVEVDPFDPAALPVKRTALGRFKHEGAAVVVGAGGRAVVYMGDDERFGYVFKFVSADDWEAMRARGESPLDRGTLYAARFDPGGAGVWLALDAADPAVRRAGLATQAEVLTFARLAADAVGATPMDRPEWAAAAPDGHIFLALTNNSARRRADAANPMAPNPDGHILRWRDAGGPTGRAFAWEIFRAAADTHGTEESFADPDGLRADPDGRLFIETDGGQKDGLNNQLLVADTRTGAVRRLFTGVPGCEITGLAATPDRRTLFVNVQHPGDGDPALTNFPVANPVPDGIAAPRDATVVITRKDGGVVGS